MLGRKWVLAIIAVMLVVQLSCAASPTYPVKTTLKEASSMIGTALPVPTYLPQGSEIREIYVTSDDTAVLLVDVQLPPEISGTPSPDGVKCEMEMRIQWWSSSFIPGGLKIPGERVPLGDTIGVLWDRDGYYSLVWQPLDTTQQGQFDLALSASKSMPKEELIKIARSVRQ